MLKFLNVAEKNDAAKHIAAILSKGTSTRREGFSKFNKIYEFTYNLNAKPTRMIFTSVSGHLLNYAFDPQYSNWSSCNPIELFDAPIAKICTDDGKLIRKTLEREIRSCDGLILWTDCDREGENIGFEILNVCTAVKRNLTQIYRAKFSEITTASVQRSINNLGQPDQNLNRAVDVRQELDLRTGAAFTRLQTLHLTRTFSTKLSRKLISYGSCQFPTLGFVVDRYKAIEDFVAEDFWSIKMNHLNTDFVWERGHLFDETTCLVLLDICTENSECLVEKVEMKPKKKYRPQPLDTVALEKMCSKKLKLTAKETMRIAEKLYSQGWISYPRTETTQFPPEIALRPLVECQTVSPKWGEFAGRILTQSNGPAPRQGSKTDKAHPPIHPLKYAANLPDNEGRIYEFITRHFLACCQKDAVGQETVVKVVCGEEKFTARGLIIIERNYLDVYIYEDWNSKTINAYTVGQKFQPTFLDIVKGATSPPKLLTEADLITLMDKHGIGTDATHADHIDTIKTREYVGLENIYLVPSTLGMGLVEGYNNIGLDVSLAKPILRAAFEQDLKAICDGQKDAEAVRVEQIRKYKQMFQSVMGRMTDIDQSLSNRLKMAPNTQSQAIMKCLKCSNGSIIIRTKKSDNRQFLTCDSYPKCKHAIWLPPNIERIEIDSTETCPQCGPNVRLLKFYYKTSNQNTESLQCIGGCNPNILEQLSR